MGEKGNLASNDALSALDAFPLDALKSSPETLNAWFATYLNLRTMRDAGRAASAAEEAAEAAQAASEAHEDETPRGS